VEPAQTIPSLLARQTVAANSTVGWQTVLVQMSGESANDQAHSDRRTSRGRQSHRQQAANRGWWVEPAVRACSRVALALSYAALVD
jgi:hypothetical protein